MVTAIDTNILLDILIPNQDFLKSSLQKLEKCSQDGDLIICEIVYAELASRFIRELDINRFLRDAKIEIIFSDRETFYKASQIWKTYLSKSSRKSYCPQCGKEIDLRCKNCNYHLNLPRRLLNDFIIGSHAQSFADVFLTRDRGFYRNYFKTMKII